MKKHQAWTLVIVIYLFNELSLHKDIDFNVYYMKNK